MSTVYRLIAIAILVVAVMLGRRFPEWNKVFFFGAIVAMFVCLFFAVRTYRRDRSR